MAVLPWYERAHFQRMWELQRRSNDEPPGAAGNSSRRFVELRGGLSDRALSPAVGTPHATQ